MANDLKDLYGKDYVERFSAQQSPNRLKRLLRYIHLEPHYKVVDFACGNGMLLPYIAPSVAAYSGVDFSDEFIREANRRKEQLGIDNAEFYCNTIQNFCEEHINFFDCGFAMDFSEHVYDDDWVAILSSIKKSIKPGGSLYLHTPNILFFLEQMKEKSIIFTQFEEHIAVRSPEENIDLLNLAGFRIEKCLLLPHYNTLRFVHFLSYIPFIGKYFKARIFIHATVPNKAS